MDPFQQQIRKATLELKLRKLEEVKVQLDQQMFGIRRELIKLEPEEEMSNTNVGDLASIDPDQLTTELEKAGFKLNWSVFRRGGVSEGVEGASQVFSVRGDHLVELWFKGPMNIMVLKTLENEEVVHTSVFVPTDVL